jgi:hypothetical protein
MNKSKEQSLRASEDPNRTFYPSRDGWLSTAGQVSFQDYHRLTEAFDNPYDFNIDGSKPPLTIYNFKVDDVTDPYSIEAVFDPVDNLDQYIEPERDSAGIALQNHRQAVQAADQYIASKYPTALKPASAKVIEYAFSDKGTGDVRKTGKGGHNATRIIGTIIHIAQHYMITNEPNVLLFTGAKEENRGPIYTKLTNLAFRSLKNTSLAGYSYYVDNSDRRDVKFWIYKEDNIPYLGDEKFNQLLINRWQQANPGQDNVYE